jgi:hypothetical protein
VSLERGPLSLVSTTEELLDRKVAAPVYKKTEYTAAGIRHADHVAPSIRKKLAITSATRGGRSVGIVRSRTQTMEFSLVFICFPSSSNLTILARDTHDESGQIRKALKWKGLCHSRAQTPTDLTRPEPCQYATSRHSGDSNEGTKQWVPSVSN